MARSIHSALFLVILAVSGVVQAQGGRLIRGCRAQLELPSSVFPSLDAKIRIYSHGQGHFSARLSARMPGQDQQQVEIHPVRISQFQLTANFMAKSLEAMTLAEKLLFQRRSLDLQLTGTAAVTSSILWDRVARAKVYQFLNDEEIPLALVEAQDAAGNPLGSFLGGSLIGVCR